MSSHLKSHFAKVKWSGEFVRSIASFGLFTKIRPTCYKLMLIINHVIVFLLIESVVW